MIHLIFKIDAKNELEELFAALLDEPENSEIGSSIEKRDIAGIQGQAGYTYEVIQRSPRANRTRRVRIDALDAPRLLRSTITESNGNSMAVEIITNRMGQQSSAIIEYRITAKSWVTKLFEPSWGARARKSFQKNLVDFVEQKLGSDEPTVTVMEAKSWGLPEAISRILLNFLFWISVFCIFGFVKRLT